MGEAFKRRLGGATSPPLRHEMSAVHPLRTFASARPQADELLSLLPAFHEDAHMGTSGFRGRGHASRHAAYHQSETPVSKDAAAR